MLVAVTKAKITEYIYGQHKPIDRLLDRAVASADTEIVHRYDVDQPPTRELFKWYGTVRRSD